jgi:hypothetical protein
LLLLPLLLLLLLPPPPLLLLLPPSIAPPDAPPFFISESESDAHFAEDATACALSAIDARPAAMRACTTWREVRK